MNNVVDFFIIVEATHTFTGKEKPLFFNENKHLFENFDKKIIHVIVDDIPNKNNPQGKEEVWSNERFQRNAISRGINCVKDLSDLSDHDFIIISDVDEIPDPNTLDVIRKRDNRIEDIYSLEMDFYYYNLNTKLQEKLYFSKIIPYKKYKDLNKPCEKLRHTSCITIPNGGWHLSYFGDKYFIQNKIMNFSHQELNHDKFTSLSI